MKKIMAVVVLIAVMMASTSMVKTFAGSGDGFTDVEPALPAIPVNIQG